MNYLVIVLLSFLIVSTLPQPCNPALGCLECSPQNLCLSCFQPYSLADGKCQIVRNIMGGDFNFDGIGGELSRSSIVRIGNPGDQDISINQNEDTKNDRPNDNEDVLVKQTSSIEKCMFEINNECIICDSGYDLLENKCVPKLGKCLQLNQFNLCNKCQERLFLDEGGQCIDLKCSRWDYYSCLSCLPGFTKSHDGICEDSNCVTIKQGSCKECIPGFYTDFKNHNLCKPLKQIIFDCAEARQTENEVQCKKCEQNYLLQENSCKKLCEIQEGSACLLCRKGYYVNQNGKCQILPEGCTSAFIQEGKVACSRCQTQYILDSKGACTRLEIAIPFCIKYQDRICKKCVEGYQLNELDGRCLEGYENCVQYNGISCIRCSPNYVLSLTKDRCTSREGCQLFSNSGLCLRCKGTYQLFDGKCVQIDELCQEVNQQTGVCRFCYDGYALVNRKCLQKNSQNCRILEQEVCQECNDRFYLKSGSCLKVSNECDSYDKGNGKCLTCTSGYILNAGTCTKEEDTGDTFIERSDINCLKFSQTQGRCKTCYSSFYLARNKCLQANSLCKTFNPIGGDCLSCFDGYTLNDGNCEFGVAPVPEPENPNNNNNANLNCADFDSVNNVCNRCGIRFYKSDGACKVVSNDCNTYDEQTGLCLTCYNGYVLRSGNCIVLSTIALTNCATPDPNNPSLCSQCLDRYYLQDGICKFVSLLCNRYNPNTGQCIDCIIGHIMIDNECKQPALGLDKQCLIYNKSAFCEECIPGYKLLDFKCTPE